MPTFMSASKAIGSVISRKTGARHLINSAKFNAQLPKPDQIRRFSSIAGVETPSVCKLIGSHDYIDFSAKSLCNGTGIVQRRQFLSCGDDAEGDVLSKVYEERRVLGQPCRRWTLSSSHCFIDSYRKTETQTSSRTSEFSLEQQSSGQFAHDDETWSLGPPVAESVSTEWTDEKHRMYLKSMEASFVDQLYNSLDSLGWRSPKKKSSDITSSRQIHRTPSGQFKVLRSGCWQKINFERPDSQLKKTHPSGFLSSPWIRHNKSSCKPQTLASPSLPGTAGLKNQAINSSGKNAVSCGSASSSEHFAACQSHSCNQDLVDSNTGIYKKKFMQ
ncbi:hypothetical protein Q3G72_033476 [Acer saccharum]|nr:hypothetical protein Q3G72_033476 [Acer saccharum]